MDDSKLVVAS